MPVPYANGHVGKAKPIGNPTSILDAAFDLLQRGFRPVTIYPPGFPLPKGRGPAKGKEPFGAAWGVKPVAEKTLAEDIARFTKKGWTPGIGIGLGPERYRASDGTLKWLADIEGDGPEAEESKAKLFGGEAVETMGWSSVRGGHDLVTIDADRIQPILARLAGFEKKGFPGVFHFPELPGLEVRVGGDFANGKVKQLQSVVPPTPGTDGTARQWGGVETVAKAPDAFYAFLEGLAHVTKAPKAREATKASAKRAVVRGDRYARAALEKELAILKATAEGGRNAQLNRSAFVLGQLIGAGALDESEVMQVLAEAARGIGLGGAETSATIASGIAAGKVQPRDLSKVGRNGRHSTNGHAEPPPGPVPPARRLGLGGGQPSIEQFSNFSVSIGIGQDEEGKPKKIERREPLRLADINDSLARLTPGWPKCVNGRLFVQGRDEQPVSLEKPAALFAWLHEHARVEWGSGVGYVARDEFFEHLRMNAEPYQAVESLPHWPSMPGVCYMHRPLPEPSGTLDGLLDFFCPATPIDRELIRAFVLTCFWGGDPGKRPAFLTTGPDKEPGQGRGIGKSTVFDVISQELVGGYLDVSPNDDIGTIKTRLLSGDGHGRIGRIDNLKTLRFSWGDFEGMITSPQISGHAMYVGNRSIANTLVWTITVNGASLSKDMAQRTVIIKLARPTYQPTWESDLRAYIQKHRWEIIAEIGRILTTEAPEIEAKTRWAAWEQGVLAHVKAPAACAVEILARQGAVDEGDADRDLVAEYFEEKLGELRHDPSTCLVFIPSRTVAEWVSEALRKHHETSQATAKLKELSLPELSYSDRPKKVGGKASRGWVWRGAEASPDARLVALASQF
jgi:hypothetical protein